MRKVAVLPSLLTLGNMICGFLAIGYSSVGDFNRGAWLILFAMVFDALDGKLARMASSASDFGGQLDSLADLVSFGVAPAFLVQSICTHLPAKIVWLFCAVFVTCAALRLARFNVETGHEEEHHAYFKGLPTPAAGGMIASLVALHFDLKGLEYDLLLLIKSLPFVTLALSGLMISKIRYAHLLQWAFKGQLPFEYLVQVVFLFFFAVLTRPYSIALLFGAYTLSGVFTTVRERVAAAVKVREQHQ